MACLSIALVAAENAWLLAGRPRIVPLGVASCLALMAVVGISGVGSLQPAIPAVGRRVLPWRNDNAPTVQ